MKARNRWIEVLILAAALALPFAAGADTPLAPPADFVHDTPGATVRGSVTQNRTTITQHAVPHSPNWSIPVWARYYALSPMADSILVLNSGGNLLTSREPDQVVMTVWYLEGDKVRHRGFTLAEVMKPADMPATASNYAWLRGISSGDTGWRLMLSDGRAITVTYR